MDQRARLSRISLFYGVLFAIGAIWAAAQQRNLLVPESWRTTSMLGNVALGIGVGLAVALLSQRLSVRFVWARRLEEALAEALGPFSTGEAALVAALSAVGEEALFRGAMQPAIGLIATSIAFGLLHVGPGKVFLPWTVMAIAAGLLFGLLALLTGDLAAPIMAHAVVNFVNLRYLSRRYLVSPAEPRA
jgi:hypothetical protein